MNDTTLARGSVVIPVLLGAVFFMTVFEIASNGESAGAGKFALVYQVFFPAFVLIAVLVSLFSFACVVLILNLYTPIDRASSVLFLLRFILVSTTIGTALGAAVFVVLFGAAAFSLQVGLFMMTLSLTHALSFAVLNRHPFFYS